MEIEVIVVNEPSEQAILNTARTIKRIFENSDILLYNGTNNISNIGDSDEPRC